LTREHQYAVAIKREKVAESREKQSLAALHAREPSPAARASLPDSQPSCPLYPQKRTFVSAIVMFVLCPKQSATLDYTTYTSASRLVMFG
jgi:hypothetical protein